MAKAAFFLLAASLPIAALANDLALTCQGQGSIMAALEMLRVLLLN